MFRNRSVLWCLLLWSFLFSYTWLTHINAQLKWRMLPIIMNIMSNLVLIPLLANKASSTKSIILALCWSILISIGIVLHSFELLDALALNIYIASMTAITSIVWCVMSHTPHITEGGFHWYMWVMLMVLTFCAGFNYQTKNALMVFIVSIAATLVVHGIYIIHVFKIQPSGVQKYQHIFRVLCGFFLTSIVLICSALFHTDKINTNVWQDIIIGVEFGLLGAIVVDFLIGFTQTPIKQTYEPTNDNVI